MKEKRIKLRDNTLKWTILIYIDYKYSNYCSEIWIECEDDEWRLWQTNNINWISYIFIGDKKDLPTIIHELLHAANYLLEYKGIELQDELQCYYQEYFFREYLRLIK